MTRWLAAGALLLIGVLLGGCGEEQPSLRYAALGDSLTRAANAATGRQCRPPAPGAPIVECPQLSWATGSDPRVDSVARRLQRAHPDRQVQAYNLARSGAGSSDLAGQAQRAVALRAQLVTVMIGGNDACGPIVTPPALFRSRAAVAFSILRRDRVQLRVLSAPSLQQLWLTLREDPAARRAWGPQPGWVRGRCPAMLDQALSRDPRVVARRRALQRRQGAYVDILEQLCRAYPGCRSDGGRQFRSRIQPRDVSQLDHFHASVQGQQQLALHAWQWLGLDHLPLQTRDG